MSGLELFPTSPWTFVAFPASSELSTAAQKYKISLENELFQGQPVWKYWLVGELVASGVWKSFCGRVGEFCPAGNGAGELQS